MIGRYVPLSCSRVRQVNFSEVKWRIGKVVNYKKKTLEQKLYSQYNHKLPGGKVLDDIIFLLLIQ